MTRETKLGLVVSTGFLCLLGGVIGRKVILGETHAAAPEPPPIVARGEPAVPPETKLAQAAPATGQATGKTPEPGPLPIDGKNLLQVKNEEAPGQNGNLSAPRGAPPAPPPVPAAKVNEFPAGPTNSGFPSVPPIAEPPAAPKRPGFPVQPGNPPAPPRALPPGPPAAQPGLIVGNDQGPAPVDLGRAAKDEVDALLMSNKQKANQFLEQQQAAGKEVVGRKLDEAFQVAQNAAKNTEDLLKQNIDKANKTAAQAVDAGARAVNNALPPLPEIPPPETITGPPSAPPVGPVGLPPLPAPGEISAPGLPMPSGNPGKPMPAGTPHMAMPKGNEIAPPLPPMLPDLPNPAVGVAPPAAPVPAVKGPPVANPPAAKPQSGLPEMPAPPVGKAVDTLPDMPLPPLPGAEAGTPTPAPKVTLSGPGDMVKAEGAVAPPPPPPITGKPGEPAHAEGPAAPAVGGTPKVEVPKALPPGPGQPAPPPVGPGEVGVGPAPPAPAGQGNTGPKGEPSRSPVPVIPKADPAVKPAEVNTPGGIRVTEGDTEPGSPGAPPAVPRIPGKASPTLPMGIAVDSAEPQEPSPAAPKDRLAGPGAQPIPVRNEDAPPMPPVRVPQPAQQRPPVREERVQVVTVEGKTTFRSQVEKFYSREQLEPLTFSGWDDAAAALLAYNVAKSPDGERLRQAGQPQPGDTILIPNPAELQRYRRTAGEAPRYQSTPPIPVVSRGPTPDSGQVVSQHRQPDVSESVPVVRANPQQPAQNARTGAVVADGTYQVAGDRETVFEIATRVLGDGRRWVEIYRLNPGINPERAIPPGTRLRLPGDARR